MNSICQFDIPVTDAVVDRNGHVNNVAYIQWLQDAAVRHARASGCTAATTAAGASWVVRSHYIEYLTDANARDNGGHTPLHWAAIQGHKDLVELLRQHGGCE